MRNRLFIIILAVCFVVGLIVCFIVYRVRVNKPLLLDKISFTTVDTSDPGNMIGFADYVFAGYVESLDKTVYKDDTGIVDGENSTPYTVYSVRLIKNIKGELEEDRTIKLTKDGGKIKESNRIRLYNGDTLPKKKKIYIFIASILPDGSMTLSGANTNILLERKIKSSNVESSEIFKRYKELYSIHAQVLRQRYMWEEDEHFTPRSNDVFTPKPSSDPQTTSTPKPTAGSSIKATPQTTAKNN